MDELQAVLDDLKATSEEMEGLTAVLDAPEHEASKEELEKWEALENKAKELRAKAEGLKKQATTSAARDRRRSVLAGAREYEQEFDRAFLRRPDYDPRRDPGSGKQLSQADFDADLADAFNAWMKMGVNPDLIDESMRNACGRLRINPGNKVFELPIGQKAYERYLRCLYADMGNDQYRSMGMSLDPRSPFSPYAATNSVPYMDSRVPEAAGFTNVPPTYMAGLERNIISYGGIYDAPISVRTVPGYEDIIQDFADDQVEGVQIGEGHPLASGANPRFGQLRWGAWDYSSLGVIITERQLEVSRYDLPDFIGEIQGERLGRVQAKKLTWGSGAAEPLGLAAAAVKGGKIVTTAGIGVISLADIRGLEYALDEAFARSPNVGWMMNLTTLSYLEGLNDSTGRPLLQLGIETTTNRRIVRNRRIFINYQMPAIASNKIAILFGDFSRYLVVRRGRGTPRLIRDTTTFANELKVVFTTLISLDGKLRDYGNCPIVCLKIQ